MCLPLASFYDTDSDSDPLTAVKDSDPANGTLTLNSDDSLPYTPDAGFSGTDSFTYEANDGTTNSGVATVTITTTRSLNENTVVCTTHKINISTNTTKDGQRSALP